MQIVTVVLVCLAASVSAQIGGGRQMDKNGNEAREAAWKGAKKITESYAQQRGNRHFIPVGIASISKQVVSGTNTKVDLIVVSSNCGLDQNIGGDFKRVYECGIDQNGTFLRCDVAIWTQSWLNKEEITVENCRPSSAREATSV